MCRYLYKYRPVNDLTIQSIKDNYVWASHPDEFNDIYDYTLAIVDMESPYDEFIEQGVDIEKVKKAINFIKECKKENIELAEKALNIKLNSSLIENGLDKFIEENFKTKKELFKKGAEDFKNKFRIASFSSEKDSFLMWSHYAKNNSGICIEYDIGGNYEKDFEHCFLKHMQGKEDFYLTKVIYSDVFMDIKRINNYERSEDINDFMGKLFYLMSKKSNDWQYEKEYRAIYVTDKKSTGEKKNFFNIRSIYLGTRISKDDKNTILELAKEKDFNVYQMKQKKFNYGFDYEEIFLC